jgi:hypothetical protein
MKPSRSLTIMLIAGTAALGALALVYQARSRPVAPTPVTRTAEPLDSGAVAQTPPPVVEAAEAVPAPAPSAKPRPQASLPPPRFLPPPPPPQPRSPAQSTPPPSSLSRPESAAALVDKSRSASEQARGVYDALGIPPEQRVQIKQVLDIQRDRMLEIRGQLTAGQIDQRGFGSAIRELRAETDANLTSILGAEGLKAWRNYQREVGKSLGPALEKMVAP